jgi:hypothetical protein
MREWNLKSGDPLSLTIAADARLGPTDYCNDQIWELSIRGGEPPSLAFQTTFGLRARSYKIFPRITEGSLTRTDPDTFASPPEIKSFAPNYLKLVFTPLSGLVFTAEYWVADSHALAGRFRIVNSSQTPRTIQLEIIGLLAPNAEGERMSPHVSGDSPVLAGVSGGLAPVLWVKGGASSETGPYPSLTQTISLHSGEIRTVYWSQAALDTFEASLSKAREVAAVNWEAVQARIDLSNSGMIEVFCGNPDWDAAFALAQKTVLGLLVGPTSHLPEAGFVSSRLPAHGYSLRGDGLDYNHLWDGQTPFNAWYLAGYLLPSTPQLLKNLIQNFLFTTREDGFVDGKPGLAGQRSKLLAAPLLASLTLRLYEHSPDLDYLKSIFPSLLSHLRLWFTPAHDRDQDGHPEWSHPLQCGLEDHPLFSSWLPWSQGVDISTVEAPALAAFLYHEIRSLTLIAELVGEEEAGQELLATAERLSAAAAAAWNEELAIYRYLDRDSHTCSSGRAIIHGSGSSRCELNQHYETPVRLRIRIETSDFPPPRPQISIHGSGINGQHLVERLDPERFFWLSTQGTATGGRVYQDLEFVTLEGLGPDDRFSISTVDLQQVDISLLLPLWAGLPDQERADLLVGAFTNPQNGFWQPHGIPVCPHPLPQDETGVAQLIHLPWNSLIGEGLLRYGCRKEAADLVYRIMETVVGSLKLNSQFAGQYHAGTGKGLGEANSLAGLPPLGLFLDVLGIHIFSPQRVAISGFNPFPWPITVKYRGMTVTREADKTVVVFPDGQTSTITEPDPCYVLLE